MSDEVREENVEEEENNEREQSSSRSSRSRRPQSRRYRGRGRKRVCDFCVENVKHLDYKEYEKLRRFLTERGKIRPRRQTGVCAKHQRVLAQAVKRARHLALLPFTADYLHGD